MNGENAKIAFGSCHICYTQLGNARKRRDPAANWKVPVCDERARTQHIVSSVHSKKYKLNKIIAIKQ